MKDNVDYLSLLSYIKSMTTLKRILILSGLIILLVRPLTAETQTSTVPFFMYNAASSFNLDVALLFAVCDVESRCQSKAMNVDDGTAEHKALGHKIKSYGLFQIQRATAVALGFKDKEIIEVKIKRHGKTVIIKKTVWHTDDLLKPEVNAWYAAKLLRNLYNKYKVTVAVVSAYNAGKPITGNKKYVDKVLRAYVKYKIDKRS